jgi:hypothetical protein
MSDSDMPVDPFIPAEILQGAQTMHTMFASLTSAGFTEQQALQIVVGILSAQVAAVTKKL